MFDELLKSDDDKDQPTGKETDAYEAGRTGTASLFDNDSSSEAEARSRGEQDKINAEETRKEDKEDKEEAEEEEDDE